MRVTVRVLSALALLFLSFAHQPAFARQITPATTADYMLPDGSIGDICYGLDGVDGHGSSHEGMAPICDYCRLATAVLLPTPPGESYLVIHLVALVSAKPNFHPLFILHPRTLPQSRAPPVLL